MRITIQELANILGGTIEGDPNTQVELLCRIEEGTQGGLSFLANPKYTSYLYTTEASAVIVKDDLVLEKAVKTNLIRVADPYACFAKLLDLYNSKTQPKTGISEKAHVCSNSSIGENSYIGEFAYIGESVQIGKNVQIYPNVYIGNHTQVGDSTILFPGVKIYSDSIIGRNCVIHAGSVIGADGFGFAPQNNQGYIKIPQIGNVIIEDDVEIGANTTVDRATLGSTLICKGVKIDNLCQVAHNVSIGENTVIAAQTGVSGSTKIGSNCMIAGQVGFAGHIQIGDEVVIGAQSGVANNIEDKKIILGTPAIEARIMRKSYVVIKKLPDLIERINSIEKKQREVSS